MSTADDALALMEAWWDDEVAMLWNPPRSFDRLVAPRTVHMVPPTVWYAVALLHRRADGDVSRAVRAIEAVIACQLNDPGTPWHGTFNRFREVAPPREGAVEYVEFDPNWRQFVGTGFALASIIAGDILPVGISDAITASIALAIEGEPPNRVSAAYSNIALMRAWLEVHAGTVLARPSLVARGEHLARSIVERFDEYDAFDEWNSPTYYGIDLYALALWRSFSSSPLLTSWGARLESDLWTDLAGWYHADLSNMAGPYSRSYGMDLRTYVAGLGLWIDQLDQLTGPRPVPTLSAPFDHAHDLSLAPIVALVQGAVPSGAADDLRSFRGSRSLEKNLPTDRVATAWLSPSLMIGAETGGRMAIARGQYHPATVHWDGGWIRPVHRGHVDAVASRDGLVLQCLGDFDTGFRLSHAPLDVTATRWQLPGMDVDVHTDAEQVGVKDNQIRYGSGRATFELSFRP